MSEKSVFAKYADYVNKYKPDLQHEPEQQESVSDYRRRLDEIKEQVYEQNKPVEAESVFEPAKELYEAPVEPKEEEAEAQKPNYELPTAITQKAAAEVIANQETAHSAVKNYVQYLQLNTLQQQTPVSTARLGVELPDDAEILELVLVRESCAILIGAKVTDNICFTETGCLFNEHIPVHLQQLLKKIVFEQTLNRMEVITKCKLLLDAGELPQKLGTLLYEALVAIDAAVWEAASDCDNLILFDSRLNGVYQTLSVLSRFAQKVTTTQNVLQQLEQFCKQLGGLSEAKTVEYILFEMCEFYVKTILFDFLIEGKINGDFIISFDETKPLLDRFQLNMSKIGIFEPVEQDILVLGRNNYIMRSVFFVDTTVETEEQNTLKRLASERLTLENVLRKLTPDNPSQFYELIQKHSKESETRLLRMIVENYNFKAALTAVSRFFLFEASDVFEIFLETSQAELEKPVEQANILRINNLFKLACETSSARNEHFLEDFFVRISQYSFLQLFHLVNDGEAQETDQMDAKVGNMLELEFRRPRELSMVFTDEFLRCLDLVFRRILREKQVDTMLTKSWLILNELKTVSRDISVFNFIYRLLNQMEDFSRQLEFETSCVLLEAEELLQEELQRVVSVDEINAALLEFAKSVLRQLRLTDSDTSMLLDTLFADCLVFSRFISQYFEFQHSDVVRELETEQQRIEAFKRNLLAEVESSKVAIKKLSDGFGEKVEKWRRIVGM